MTRLTRMADPPMGTLTGAGRGPQPQLPSCVSRPREASRPSPPPWQQDLNLDLCWCYSMSSHRDQIANALLPWDGCNLRGVCCCHAPWCGGRGVNALLISQINAWLLSVLLGCCMTLFGEKRSSAPPVTIRYVQPSQGLGSTSLGHVPADRLKPPLSAEADEMAQLLIACSRPNSSCSAFGLGAGYATSPSLPPFLRASSPAVPGRWDEGVGPQPQPCLQWCHESLARGALDAPNNPNCGLKEGTGKGRTTFP